MQNTKMKPCNLFSSRLDLFLDHRLDETSAGEVSRHLNDCSGCREYVGFHRSLLQDAGAELKKEIPVNPYFYAGLMEKIDRQPVKPRWNTSRVALAGSLVSGAGAVLVYTFLLSGDPESPASPLLTALPARETVQTLISAPEPSEMLGFLQQESIPVDAARTEFVRIVRNDAGMPGLLVSAADPSEDSIRSEFAAEISRFLTSRPPEDLTRELRVFAGRLTAGLLIDSKGRLLIHPSVFSLKDQLQASLSRFSGQNLAGRIETLQNRFGNRAALAARTSLLISLPEKSDVVHLSDSSREEYALIPVDAFTVRSLRLTVPRLSRVVPESFLTQPEPRYTVVETRRPVFSRSVPEESQIQIAGLAGSESKLSIIEANQLLYALRNGLRPSDDLLARARQDKAFSAYLSETGALEPGSSYRREAGPGNRVQVVGLGTGSSQRPAVKTKTPGDSATALDHE